jgi:hypothetical protein
VQHRRRYPSSLAATEASCSSRLSPDARRRADRNLRGRRRVAPPTTGGDTAFFPTSISAPILPPKAGITLGSQRRRPSLLAFGDFGFFFVNQWI